MAFRSSRAALGGLFLFILAVVFGCNTTPPAVDTAAPSDTADRPVRGVAEEIRYQVETGTPASLQAAVELIQQRSLGSSDYGRVMNAAAASLLRGVYPDTPVRYFPPDPPQTHPYTRILREADRGIYTPPAPDSTDFLEYTLPFLAWYAAGELTAAGQRAGGNIRNALPDLEKAAGLNPDSALPALFRGFIFERTGAPVEAEAAYRAALAVSGGCYPAELGLVRLLHRAGKTEEERNALAELMVRYPDNMAIKKQLARSYVERRDWSRAEPAVSEILQRNPRDGEFLLLRARIAVEQGQYQQAQAPLDSYATIDTTAREYLFLRARIQAESYHNRDAALNYLRSITRSYPDDAEAAIYMAGLLMGSSRTEDVTEGQNLLARLLSAQNPSMGVLSLAVEDAIRREAWRDAKVFLDRLLAGRRENRDLLDAYQVERGLGNNAAALAWARELYNRDSANEEAAAAYITALIDTGRQADAGKIIDQRLAALPGGVHKSKYYYLRSRLRTTDDAVMNDLRSALFEDPRNLDALVAMFEIYHRRKDDRRAVYYLKQALALAPNNPLLKRYETEYRTLLNQ